MSNPKTVKEDQVATKQKRSRSKQKKENVEPDANNILAEVNMQSPKVEEKPSYKQ